LYLILRSREYLYPSLPCQIKGPHRCLDGLRSQARNFPFPLWRKFRFICSRTHNPLPPQRGSPPQRLRSEPLHCGPKAARHTIRRAALTRSNPPALRAAPAYAPAHDFRLNDEPAQAVSTACAPAPRVCRAVRFPWDTVCQPAGDRRPSKPGADHRQACERESQRRRPARQRRRTGRLSVWTKAARREHRRAAFPVRPARESLACAFASASSTRTGQHRPSACRTPRQADSRKIQTASLTGNAAAGQPGRTQVKTGDTAHPLAEPPASRQSENPNRQSDRRCSRRTARQNPSQNRRHRPSACRTPRQADSRRTQTAILTGDASAGQPGSTQVKTGSTVRPLAGPHGKSTDGKPKSPFRPAMQPPARTTELRLNISKGPALHSEEIANLPMFPTLVLRGFPGAQSMEKITKEQYAKAVIELVNLARMPHLRRSWGAFP
jgi:hypothetical protein